MEIRPFTPVDLDQVLDLIKRSDSTDRSESTWLQNNLTGMLAFDNKKLIGAIPLEPRNFSLGYGKTIKTLWVTGAHVDPQFRSKGIGTRLNEKIREAFSPEYQAIFVYRDIDNNPAYRWYSRLEYHPLLPVLGFGRKVTLRQIDFPFSFYANLEDIQDIEVQLYQCYEKNCGQFGGCPRRHENFWLEKISAHYYKEYYKYSLLTIAGEKGIESYALLGETAFRDNIQRFDILELCAPDSNTAREKLFCAAIKVAEQFNLEELRIQLSYQDPAIRWVQHNGFEFKRRTYILGHLFDPIEYLKFHLKTVEMFEEDFKITIETPTIKETTLGGGEKEVCLFMQDQELTRLLMRRQDLSAAVEEGRIITKKYNKEALSLLGKIFSPSVWLFHQVDHV